MSLFARLYILVSFLLIRFCNTTVFILKNVENIYDTSAKLRIRGSGFEHVNDANIYVKISPEGEKALKVNRDFVISKAYDGITLTLLDDKRWVKFGNDNVNSVNLVLSVVKLYMEGKEEENLLPTALVVANVIPTPSILDSSPDLNLSEYGNLTIHGENLKGATSIAFLFSPEIVDYTIMSPLPLQQNAVYIMLRCDVSGPLYVVSVDTGGGALTLNAKVANIVPQYPPSSLLSDTSDYSSISVHPLSRPSSFNYSNIDKINPSQDPTVSTIVHVTSTISYLAIIGFFLFVFSTILLYKNSRASTGWVAQSSHYLLLNNPKKWPEAFRGDDGRESPTFSKDNYEMMMQDNLFKPIQSAIGYSPSSLDSTGEETPLFRVSSKSAFI